jgi:hypothetical protein
MARSKTSAEIREQILRLMEAEKELKRKEKEESRKLEEKIASKLGHFVLGIYRAGFTGFDKGDFKKKVAEIIASCQPDSATLAASATQVETKTSAELSDAGESDEEAAEAVQDADIGDTGATAEAATEKTDLLTAEAGSIDQHPQNSERHSFFSRS